MARHLQQVRPVHSRGRHLNENLAGTDLGTVRLDQDRHTVNALYAPHENPLALAFSKSKARGSMKLAKQPHERYPKPCSI